VGNADFHKQHRLQAVIAKGEVGPYQQLFSFGGLLIVEVAGKARVALNVFVHTALLQHPMRGEYGCLQNFGERTLIILRPNGVQGGYFELA